MINHALRARKYDRPEIKWLTSESEDCILPELKLQGYISKKLHALAKQVAPDDTKALIKEIQFICAAVLDACWKARHGRRTYDSLPSIVRGTTRPAAMQHARPPDGRAG
jgi:hypothetical protein